MDVFFVTSTNEPFTSHIIPRYKVINVNFIHTVYYILIWEIRTGGGD